MEEPITLPAEQEDAQAMKGKRSLAPIIAGMLFWIYIILDATDCFSLFFLSSPRLFLRDYLRIDGIFVFYIILAVSAVVLFLRKRNFILPGIFAVAMLYCMYYTFRVTSNGARLLVWLRWGLPSLGFAGMLFLCLVEMMNIFPRAQGITKKLWFLPAIFFVDAWRIGVLTSSISFYIRHIGYFLPYLIGIAARVCAALFTCRWTVRPEGKPKKIRYAPDGTALDPIYCRMVKHILLLIFTCGIWFLIWIYRTTDYLNCVEDEEKRTPVAQLLLCMFIPFYQIYWTYKSAQRIDKLAHAKGMTSDSATLCLVLAIFIGIVPPIIMQDKINTIITSKETAAPVSVSSTTATVSSASDVDELVKFKSLLDSGIITQEEFDAKKKQILGV